MAHESNGVPAPAVTIESIVRVPKDVLFRELDGEAVLLNLEQGTYFGLDPIGTRIWRLCEEHGSLGAVWRVLQQEFDAPEETLRSDLLTFVSELSSQGLVALQ